jgi:heat shock protein 5
MLLVLTWELRECRLLLAWRFQHDWRAYTHSLSLSFSYRYSCVGIQRGGRVEIITNDQGNRITPSYVGFVEDERLIGDAAKNQAAQNPENTM